MARFSADQWGEVGRRQRLAVSRLQLAVTELADDTLRLTRRAAARKRTPRIARYAGATGSYVTPAPVRRSFSW
jgi:hypothetical protein